MSGTAYYQGPLNWVSGNFNGTGTTTFGATSVISITSANLHDFNQRALVNEGVFNWTDGQIRAGNGASFTNTTVFNDTASSQFNSAYGGTWTFTNAPGGTYRRSGSGITTATSGVSFSNAGRLQLDHGTLQLNSSLGLQSSSELAYTLSGAATDGGYGLLSVSTALALSGMLQITFGAGFENSVTAIDTFTLLSASSLSGSFANVANGGRLVTSDGLGSFQVNYGAGSIFTANQVVLSGFAAVPEPSTWAPLLLGGAIVALGARRRRAQVRSAARPGAAS